MSRTWWVHRLFNRRSTAASVAVSPAARPQVLWLEDRVTPASSVTLVGGVSGSGSLDATFLANGHNLFFADPDVGGNTLSSGALGSSTNKDVTVEARGPITFDYPANSTTVQLLTSANTVTFSTDDPAGGDIRFLEPTSGFSTGGSVAVRSAAGVSLGNLSAFGGVTVTAGTRTAADITFAGTTRAVGGSLTATSPRNITVASGGKVLTAAGDLTLSANRQATPTAGNFTGVTVSGTVQATGIGAVSVSGTGGTDPGGNQYGVYLSGGTINGGTAGTTVVSGTGGPGAGAFNAGVVVLGTGSTITSAGAAVAVTGQGGGSGASVADYGVGLQDGGTITAGGTGAVTVTGTGGVGTGGFQTGVFVNGSAAAAAVTSAGGPVTVTGAAGSAGATAFLAVVLQTGGANTAGITGGGNAGVTIVADSLLANGGSGNTTISAGTGTVTLRPRTAGTTIDLGGNDVLTGSPLTLGLDADELNRITAGVLRVGDSTTGAVTVSADIAPTKTSQLELVTAGGISGSGKLTVTRLGLTAGTGVNVVTAAGNVEATTAAGGVTISNTGALTVGGVSGALAGVLAAGAVSLSTAGNITAAEPVSGSSVSVTAAAGTFTNQAAVSATGSGAVVVRADAFDLQAGSSLTTAGEVNLRADSAGVGIDLGSTAAGFALSQAELDTVSAAALRLTASADITVSQAVTVAANQVPELRLEAAAGAVSGTGQRLTAGRLSVAAANAVGLTTAVQTVAASSSGGDVTIANTGALTVGTVNGLVGVTGKGVAISTASPLTVASDVTGSAAVTLTAGDSAATGDDLTVNPGVTVRSTGGDVALNAGDNLLVDLAATVKSDAGTVFLRVDFGDADPGVGATLVVPVVFAGAAVQVVGGPDADTFTVSGTAAGVTATLTAGAGADTVNVTKTSATGPLVVNAGAGLDVVNIGNTGSVGSPGLLTPVAGPVTVDGGTEGAALTVDGSGAGVNADYAVTDTAVTRSTPAGFGGVTYSNLTTLLVTVGAGANVVTVSNTAAGVTTTVNTNAGNDTVNVTKTNATGPLTINTGLGADAVNVGNTGVIGSPGLLTPVAGAVTVDGGSDGAALTVDGSGAGVAADYSVTGTAVTRSTPAGFGGVTYGNLTSLLLTVGSGANVVSVLGTSVPTTVNTNAGNDTVNITGPGVLAALAVNTGTENDAVTVDGAPAAAVTVDGGAGTDALTVNGSALADTFVVAPDGTRVSVGQTGPAPFTLDVGTVETVTINALAGADSLTAQNLAGVADLVTLQLNGGADDDSFFVTPSAAVGVRVDGGSPVAPATPGDSLTLDAENNPLSQAYGADASSGTLSVTGRQPVLFTSIETLAANNVSATQVIGTAAADTVVLYRDATNTLVYTVNGGLPLAVFGPQFRFDGLGGKDRLQVDYKGGDPLSGLYDAPSGKEAVAFDGSDKQGDTLLVVGPGATAAAGRTALYVPTAAGAGRVELADLGGLPAGRRVVTFQNLTPVDLTGLAVVTISPAGAVDKLTVSEGFDHTTGTNPALLVGGTSDAFAVEELAAWNNGGLVVDAPGAGSTLTVLGAANAHGNTDLTFTSETVSVRGNVTAAGTVTLANSGTLTLGGAGVVTVSGGTGVVQNGAGPVTLADDAVLTSAAGPVSVKTAVDSAAAGANTLTAAAANGTVTLLDSVGATTRPAGLNVTGKAVVLGGAAYQTKLVQTFTGPTTVSAPAVRFDSATQGVAFFGTLDSAAGPTPASAVTVSTVTGLLFGDKVGTARPLASLDVQAGLTTIAGAAGGAVTSVGRQRYGGPVVLATDAVLTGGEFVFDGRVDGDASPNPNRALTVTVTDPTKAAAFNAPVGLGGPGTTPPFTTQTLQSLTVNGASLFAGAGAGVRTVGDQNYNGPVRLAADAQFASVPAIDYSVASGTGAITFAGTLDGGFAADVFSTGDITFTGAVGGAAPLASLRAGAGQTFVAGGLVTTAGPQTYLGPVLLRSNVTFTATNPPPTVPGGQPVGDVTFASNLNAANGPGALNIYGAVVNTPGGGTTTFNNKVGYDYIPAFGRLAYLKTDQAGRTVIGSATSADDILNVEAVSELTFNDPVVLGKTVRFFTRPDAGGPVTFGSTLDGTTVGGQTANVSAFFGDIRFGGAVGGGVPLANLYASPGVFSSTQVDGGLVRTVGDQKLEGRTVLGADTRFEAGSAGSIIFASYNYYSLDSGNGPGSPYGATVQAGAAVFVRGRVGEQPLRYLRVGTGPTGYIQLDSDQITTTEDQRYDAAVNLSQGVLFRTVDASGTAPGTGPVTFTALNGPSSATVRTAGTTTFNGPVGLGQLVGVLVTDGGGLTVFNGKLVATNGEQRFGDDVRVGTDTDFSSTFGPVAFASKLDGRFAVRVTTPGLTTFGGAVGATDPLRQLTTDGGGDTLVSGGLVQTEGVALADKLSGDQRFRDRVLVAGVARFVTLGAAGGRAVTFNANLESSPAGTADVIVTPAAGGSVTFVGSVAQLSSLTVNGGTGFVRTATVNTVNGQTFAVPVRLGGADLDGVFDGADVVFTSTAGGAVTFASTLDAFAPSGVRGATVSTTGATTFGGPVGGAEPLAFLGTNPGGTTFVGGGLVRTVGGQTFGDDVILTVLPPVAGQPVDTLFQTGPAGFVTFNGKLDALTRGVQGATVRTAGGTTFAGPVGGTTALAYLATDGGGTAFVTGGLVSTVGGQFFFDPVSVAGNATFQTVDPATGAVPGVGPISFLDAGPNSLTATGTVTICTAGPVTFEGAVTVAGLSVECNGAIDLNGGSVSTPGGVQRYAGDVLLTADTTLTAAGVIFDRRVDADSQADPKSLTVNAGVTTFGGGVGTAPEAGRFPLEFLTVPGLLNVNGGAVRTLFNQTYGPLGAVRVGGQNAVFSTGPDDLAIVGTGDIVFNGPLDQSAGLPAGTVGARVTTAGLTRFGTSVGVLADGRQLAFLTTDGGGTTRFGGTLSVPNLTVAVSTTGPQVYADPVVVQDADEFQFRTTAANGDVTFGATLDGSGSGREGVRVLAGGGGVVRFNGPVGTAAPPRFLAVETGSRVEVNASPVRTGGSQAFFVPVTVAQDTTFGAGSDVVFGQALTGPFAVTVNSPALTFFGGPVNLQALTTNAGGSTEVRGGSVTTTAGQVFNDPVRVTADATFAAATVRFADTLDGPAGATVNAAATFSKAVGAATPLAFLTVNGPAAVDGGLVRTVAAQAFNGPVAVSAGTEFGGGDVRFNGTLTGTVPVAVNSPGETAFNGDVAVSSLTTDAPGRTSVGAANVAATGAVLFNDPVTTFAPAVTFSGGSVRFATALGNAGTDVTVNSGGPTTFDGEVRVGSLRTDAAGTTAVNGGLVETVRFQQYGDPVAVGRATTFRSTGGGAVSFEQTLSGPYAVAVETADNTVFLGAVDVDSLRTDAGGFTRVNGGRVRTAGGQELNDAVTVDAKDALFESTGNQPITFNGTLDGIAGREKGVTLRTAGETTLNGTVGAFAPLGSLLADGGGRTVLGGGGGLVSTTGAQEYADAVQARRLGTHRFSGGRIVIRDRFEAADGTTRLEFSANEFVQAGGLLSAGTVSAVFGTGTLAGTVDVADALDLTAAGSLAQPAGSVRANRLLLASPGRTDIRLDQPANDFNTLTAVLGGGSTLYLSDANALSLADAGVVVGDPGTVRLRTGGDFTAAATSRVNVGAGGQFVMYPGLAGPATAKFQAPATARQVVLGQPGTRTNGTSDLVAPPTPGQSAVPGYVSPTDLPDEAGAPAFGAGNVGADTFNVRPAAGARVFVFGNSPRLPLNGAAGDTLQPEFVGADGKTALAVTGFGTNGQDGFYDLTGAQRLTFNSIEGLAGLSQAAFVAQTGEPGDATGATSQQYNVRVVRTQNGTPLPGGLQGARLPENPFVVSPALVDPAASTQPPRTAFGDFNGDNIPDLVLANGPGTPPLVTVIDGRALDPTLNPGGQLTDISRLPAAYLLAQFYAYDPGFQGGVNVAVGKLGANGEQTITTGADEGGGPHVRTFALRYVGQVLPDGKTPNPAFDKTSPTPFVPAQLNTSFGNFFAYEAAFTGGVRVAVADVTGDGRDDLVLTPGAGGGPRVRVFAGEEWAGRTDAIVGTTRAFADFFTVEESFRGGLYVAAGKYRPGARADILVGAASGGAPRVMIFDTGGMTAGTTQTPTVLANFFAFDLAPNGTLNDPLFGRANSFTGVGGVSFGGRGSSGGYLDVLVSTARGPQLQVRRFAGGVAGADGGLKLAEEFTTSGSTKALVSVAGTTLKAGSLNYGATVGGFVDG